MVRAVALVGVFVLAACASSSGTRSGSGDSDIIGADELGTVRVATAYEIVERLRPAFLRGRGQVTINAEGSPYPVVYVDGMRQGGPEALRRIPAQDVREIRYIRASDATTRYGTGHASGVIEVSTRRGL